MSLSEQERQIIREMEARLREHERAFPGRVKDAKLLFSRGNARWAALAFVGGFALLLIAFSSSVLVGTLGFLVMLRSSLVLANGYGRRIPSRLKPSTDRSRSR